MMKCDPRAFAKCPYRAQCGDSPKHAEFAEGSECDDFNRDIINAPLTNADRIRAMSDEELAKEMCHRSIDAICDIVCGGDCKAIKTLNRTSKEVCRDIILAWLHRPVEEETSCK